MKPPMLLLLTLAPALGYAQPLQLPPELAAAARIVDSGEALVRANAWRGKTEDFVRMWLDPSTPDGQQRLGRLTPTPEGLFCFMLAGIDVALAAVKEALRAKGVAAPVAFPALERVLAQLHDRCRDTGGKAAEDEWLAIGKLLQKLPDPQGPLSKFSEGERVLAQLNARGMLIGTCMPGGFCAPSWLAPPMVPRETMGVMIAATMALGLMAYAEPVTLPVLMRLVGRGSPVP